MLLRQVEIDFVEGLPVDLLASALKSAAFMECERDVDPHFDGGVAQR